MGLALGVGVLEYTVPNPNLRPSYLYGTISGRAAAAEVAAVEKAKAAYAEGVHAGELRAQIVYDQKAAVIETEKVNAINAFAAKVDQEKLQALAVLQADLDRTTQAWNSAYGLTQTALNGAIAMEGDLVRIRSTQVAQNQGAKGGMANLLDGVGMLGQLFQIPELSTVTGNSLRSEMTREITTNGIQDAGAMAQSIMSRFPNPAQWRLEREDALNRAFAPR